MMMGNYLDKGGSPPSSPTFASFSHLLVRRSRTIFLIACLLLTVTSICTLYSDKLNGPSYKLPHSDLRPAKTHQSSSSSSGSGNGRVANLIPPKIWQIMLPKGGSDADLYNVDPENLRETKTWLAKNIDYQYTLLGPRTADNFVENTFSNDQRLLQTYHNLTNMGMKSDLLRYLLLSVEGGVYSDVDTVALRPVDSWVPRTLRDKIRLIVGIEFDKRNGPNWADIPHDLQFCQWTIAAAPGHRVFTTMVNRILNSVDVLQEKHQKYMSEITPTSFEVMNSTGPAAWTDAVFETLQSIDKSLNETKDLAYMTEARVFDDILILPINGFGMGQIHSDSRHDGTIPAEALIKHEFWGSWRTSKAEDDKKKKEKEEKEHEEKKKAEEAKKKAEEEKKAAEVKKQQEEARKAEEELNKKLAEQKAAEAKAIEEARKKVEAQLVATEKKEDDDDDKKKKKVDVWDPNEKLAVDKSSPPR